MTQHVDTAAGLPESQPGWLLDASDPRQVAVLRQAIRAVLIAGLVAFVVQGADRPADPSLAPPAASTTVAPAPPPGGPGTTAGEATG